MASHPKNSSPGKWGAPLPSPEKTPSSGDEVEDDNEAIDIANTPPPIFKYTEKGKVIGALKLRRRNKHLPESNAATDSAATFNIKDDGDILFKESQALRIPNADSTGSSPNKKHNVLHLLPAQVYKIGRDYPFSQLTSNKLISREAALIKTTHHSLIIVRTGRAKLRLKRSSLPALVLEKNRDYLLFHNDDIHFGHEPTTFAAGQGEEYTLVVQYISEIGRPPLPPAPPRKEP